jgi:hypothetical protein
VVTEGEHIEVSCTVNFNGAPPELFQVELFYLLHDRDEHRAIPMQPKDAKKSPGVFQCTFEITGRGQFSLNARIRPSAPIVQDLYPDLLKWAE